MSRPCFSVHMESVLFVILSSALISIGGNAMADCQVGWYRPNPNGQCVRCSVCPHNQIIRETCYEDRDTVCGPFKEFQMFQGSNTMKIYHETAHATQKPVSDDKVTRQEAEEGNNYWHTITMVMIAVLCVAGLLLVGFIVAVCYRCRKEDKERLMTQVDKDSDFERLDPEIPTTSSGRTGALLSPIREKPNSVEQFEIAMEPENT